MAKNKNKTYTGTGSDKPAASDRLISISTKKSAQRVENAKMVPIFEIDDQVYAMSSAPRAEIGLTFIELNVTKGADVAAHYLLTETLGEEAYAALRAVKGLDPDQFQGVLMRVQALAVPKARGGNRKSRRA